MFDNLSKLVINKYNGGVFPLYFKDDKTCGTGLCNTSIFVDDKIRLNIRHVEYSLWHSESGKYQSREQGSISYYHREDKNELKTNNYYCELDPETFKITRVNLIDTSKLDVKPIWNFIGLEDARLVKWQNKYYLSGVRRDTTPNGVGRMELSELEINDETVKEVSRTRIDVPDKNSYCEKNWMPFLNKPYHYVKWSNPTEIVKINLEDKISETIYSGEKITSLKRDIRGSSQVIEWFDDTYLCITHETDFVPQDINGWKDADYYHRFVIFNSDYSIKYVSDDFNFMCARVEFCVGMAEHKEDILITFGFQDNGSYLLKINKESLREVLDTELNKRELLETELNNKSSLCNLAEKYYVDKCPKYHHYYTPEYNKILKDKKYSTMLEIGIGYSELMQKYTTSDYKSGASLYMWRDYFKDCIIHGADIRDININEDRIHIHKCDQSDEKSLISLISNIGNLDFIIDDGSHIIEHQILSFNILSRFCNDIYIIEDINYEDIHKIEEICPIDFTFSSYIHNNDVQGFVCFQRIKHKMRDINIYLN